MAYDLSVLVPARNEEWLAQTIKDILANKRGKTEVIAVLDGQWADPGIEDHPDVTLIHRAQSIGQRAATNEAARLSTAKFIAKLDAHCAVDEGFDVKLMADCEYDWTVIPRMYNLHVFDWKCLRCGTQTYQGPKPANCDRCGHHKTDFEKVLVWKPKDGKEGRPKRETDFARFDRTLHFQYWGDYKRRPEAEGDIADTMSFIGACFFMHRERYWELDGLDEEHGSWGQMGTEIACKTWLSGGRLVVNKKTWFAHLFRTQPGFGFPYPNPGVQKARERSKDLWLNNKWPKAKYPLSWLIEKFSPVPDWEPVGEVSKGAVYYTENRCPEPIFSTVQHQLKKCLNGHQLVSVSLKPIEFGENITLDAERGYLTMFRQILAGLEKSTADVVFLVEHDVIYSKEHFDFVPPRKDVFYYNEHTYKVSSETGQAVFYYTKQTSGLCAYRELLIEHYRKRVERVEKEGFQRSMGFEPGCHRFPRGVDNYPAERWMSEVPNVDVRHTTNLTPTRWSQDQFRNPKSCQGWKLVDEIPGWGVTKGRFSDFIANIWA